MAMRSGNEPVTARSPLRLRFWLGVWGLVWAAAGTASSRWWAAPAGRPPAGCWRWSWPWTCS